MNKRTTKEVVKHRLEARGWKGEAVFSTLNTWSLRNVRGKEMGSLSMKKKITVIISGSETWVFSIRISCWINLVLSQRHDPHSLKHTFFHKNQCASTPRPSHSWGVKLASAHRKPKQSQNKFFSFFSEKNVKTIYIYKYGFVENISDLCINWRPIKDKILSLGKALSYFFLVWGQQTHTKPLTAFLSPSLWTKRWQVGGDWSRFRGSLLPWHYSRRVEKHISITHILTLFWEMHWSDQERTLNYIKIYWLGNTKNIICKNWGCMFPPT